MKQFFKEVRKRWKAKSPKIFRRIQRLSVFLAIIAGIPAVLDGVGYQLPEPLDTMANKIVAISAVVSYLVAKLPIETKDANEIIKDT